MKKIFFLTLIIFVLNQKSSGQSLSDSEDIEQTIRTFFDGFHQKDSVVLTSILFKQIQIQTIKYNSENNHLYIENESIENFIKSITLIPDNVNFKEVIHDYQIKSDGLLATAWTPYSFYVNDNLSHCGTNNFQLLNDDGVWKIISIIDTRKKENCKP